MCNEPFSPEKVLELSVAVKEKSEAYHLAYETFEKAQATLEKAKQNLKFYLREHGVLNT